MIHIPIERLSVSSARSGGPGGQNVNKVETKVEIRFLLADADWIPEATRGRLAAQQRGRITQDGELVIVSSRTRSRQRNLEDCLEKLREAIERASRVPKRRVPTRPGRAARERRVTTKRQRSDTKRGRRRVDPSEH